MEDSNKKNKKKEKKYKMNKIWIQQQNIMPEGMLERMFLQKRLLKNSVELLNGEEKIDKNKEKIFKSKNKEFKRSLSSNIIEGVSPYAKKILLKIEKHIKRMKKSISDITKMNGLYLEQNARNTFQNENNHKNENSSKYKNIRLDNLLRNENYSKTFLNDKNSSNRKNFLSDDDNTHEEKNKKEDYVKNFMYVNDNYRKQLNFAFLKYNPISHLANLKILIQADPSIRKDISKIKEEVEEDIKWKCDKYHFRKKYLNFISKYTRSNSVQPMPISPKPMKSKNKTIFPKIKKMVTPQYSRAKSINFFDKIKNRENQKYTNQKGNKIEEMNQMLNATTEINNLIKNDNINKKINLYKTDYEQKMYYTNRDSLKYNKKLINKDYFLDDKKRVVEQIGNAYCFQISRNAKEKEKLLKGKIINENNKMHKRIIDGKKNIMEEIYTYIEDNQVETGRNDI